MCRWWSRGDLSLLWGHYHFELIFEHFFTSTKNLDMGQTHSPFGYARISKALVQLPLSKAAIMIELEWITSFKRNAKFLFALRPICIWNFNGQVRWSFSFYSSVLQTPIYSQSWCFFLFEHCTLQLPTTLRVNLLLHHMVFYKTFTPISIHLIWKGINVSLLSFRTLHTHQRAIFL